jgi:thioredoxin-dependent peroxiredoxin
MIHDMQLSEILLNECRSPRFYNAQRKQEAWMAKLLLLVLIVIAVAAIFLLPRLLSSSRAIPVPGTIAPDFTLLSQEGKSVSLKEFSGKWVVLYFYPKDQTPGCTREAHNFQLDQSKYDQRNSVVLGVSLDSADSHKKFCTKEGLNFKLLADRDGKVSEEYGSLTNLGVAKFAARHTFLIDPSGKVRKAYTRVDPSRHSEDVLAALDLLQK